MTNVTKCTRFVATVTALGITAPALLLLSAAGAAPAPIWVLAYGAADHVVAEHERTEASTWVTTATNFGSAVGTAVTGALAASHGTSTPLVAAAGLAVVTAALTLAGWTKTG